MLEKLTQLLHSVYNVLGYDNKLSRFFSWESDPIYTITFNLDEYTTLSINLQERRYLKRKSGTSFYTQEAICIDVKYINTPRYVRDSKYLSHIAKIFHNHVLDSSIENNVLEVLYISTDGSDLIEELLTYTPEELELYLKML